jgi:hypothetical protein
MAGRPIQIFLHENYCKSTAIPENMSLEKRHVSEEKCRKKYKGGITSSEKTSRRMENTEKT